jgi:hypothetical protein
MSPIMRTEGEVAKQRAELLQLEEMTGEMIVTAFRLSPGVERHNSLMLIDSFRDRIAAMKRLQAIRTGPGEKPRAYNFRVARDI